MILNTKEERAAKLFDYVQTLLEIEDPKNLKILRVGSLPAGFGIDYQVYSDDEDAWRSSNLSLTCAAILLIEFTKSNNNDSKRIL